MQDIGFTSKQVVWLFDISRETLRKWREKGLPYSEQKKLYPLKACHDWVRENIWMTRGERQELNQYKIRDAKAKAQLKELDLAERKGALIPRDQSITWLSILINEARIGFLGLPRRLAPMLAGLTDNTEIELKILEEIKRILTQLSQPLKGKKS